MSNAYLYVFTPKDFDRKDVTEYLDTLEGIESWFYSIPNCIFIVGTIPAWKLSKMLINKFGDHRHFVTLISKTARAGWMPKDHWNKLPDEKAS
jgi:hypothetical protein